MRYRAVGYDADFFGPDPVIDHEQSASYGTTARLFDILPIHPTASKFLSEQAKNTITVQPNSADLRLSSTADLNQGYDKTLMTSTRSNRQDESNDTCT